MPQLDLVIRGGTAVTIAGPTLCDVGISGGEIVALGRSLGPAAQEIDATGKLVLPGGIDTHCHIEQPKTSGPPNADSFQTGTTSAAYGGTTSVICFAPQAKGEGITGAVADYHARAERGAVIDYSFHIILTDPTPSVLAELPPLIASGHRSLKIFMTYEPSFVTDEQVLDVLAFARRHGAFVVVHAENHAAIKWMTRQLEQAGLTSPKYFPWSKPAVVEREATHRIIALAELVDQPIQVFHVTCAESIEEIRRAQARGLKVHGETCPQYLAMTADDTDRPGFEGAKFICSPALRSKADQEALWLALQTGVLQVVSSDHAPTRYAGPEGKQYAGLDAPFSKVPNGMPGLETRMPYLFSEGVRKGRLSLEQFVAVTATNPARLFGLAPKKGSIAVGADADLAIWDPELTRTVRAAELHSGTDYTPYEGVALTGWPVTVLSRGRAVVLDGRNLAEPGAGRFLPREPYAEIAPLGRFPTPFNPHGEVA